MGTDLYWKQTPKEPEEGYNSLYFSTWHFLAELWNKEEREDLDGIKLTTNDLKELKTILLTAKQSNNNDLAEDIQELINAINKFESITLFIRS